MLIFYWFQNDADLSKLDVSAGITRFEDPTITRRGGISVFIHNLCILSMYSEKNQIKIASLANANYYYYRLANIFQYLLFLFLENRPYNYRNQRHNCP